MSLTPKGSATRLLMYLVVTPMVLSGFGMRIEAALYGVIYGGAGRIPADLSERQPAMAHSLVSKLLHIVAALYHQFLLRDSLFRRMWFGAHR